MRFKRLTSKHEVMELIASLNLIGKPVACDFETTGLDVWKDKITDIAITGHGDMDAACFDVEWLDCLLQLTTPTVWHNFKYDFEIAYRGHGVDLLHLKGEFYDTMLLDHIYDENQSHSLNDIVLRTWGDSYKQIFWKTYANYIEAPEEAKIDYMCRDVWYTSLLYNKFATEISSGNISRHLAAFIHDFARILYRAERRGVAVDAAFLADCGLELKARLYAIDTEQRAAVSNEIEYLELKWWREAVDKKTTERSKAFVKRPRFNFNSPKQVTTLLYDVLNLPVQLNFKTKKPTKAEGSLKEIEQYHPVVPLLRKGMKLSKMYSSFVVGTLEHLRDNRVYPKFNINGTVTGRISCSQPNMQQIPAHGEWAKLRSMFVAEPGLQIVSIDYSQLEICVAAHYANDPILSELIIRGESMHDETARSCDITRDQAKKLNFTVLYGGTAYKVAYDLGCTLEVAKQYLERLFTRYHGLKGLIDLCHNKVERGQYIENVFGRRRHFTGKYKNLNELNRAKRQGFNSLIQGTGADLTHTALILIADYLEQAKIGHVMFPIHDEILFEIKPEAFLEHAPVIKSLMESVPKTAGFTVPIYAEMSEPAERWTS